VRRNHTFRATGVTGKCSAKALSQRGFIRATNALQILTVEDQFDLASFRQNRAQAAILSFAGSPDVIMSIDLINEAKSKESVKGQPQAL